MLMLVDAQDVDVDDAMCDDGDDDGDGKLDDVVDDENVHVAVYASTFGHREHPLYY